MTHTPGPWHLRMDVYSEMICITTESKIITAESKIIAQLPGPDGTDTTERLQKADARLIAAAPELLMALKLAGDTLDIVAAKFGSATGPNGCNTLPARQAAQVAIAKAQPD